MARGTGARARERHLSVVWAAQEGHEHTVSASQEAIDMAIVAARAASDLKATSIVALDVSDRIVITDALVIISGSTERHVRAIVDDVEAAVEKAGLRRKSREGLEGEARWVLLDFGLINVHVQHDEAREFYALEKLWADCPVIELPEDIQAEARAEAEGEASDLAAYFDFSDLGN